jgi:hypothetical protein
MGGIVYLPFCRVCRWSMRLAVARVQRAAMPVIGLVGPEPTVAIQGRLKTL